MASDITVQVDGLPKLRKKFQAMEKAGDNLPLRATGLRMLESVRRNFLAEGRPNRWIPSKRKNDPRHPHRNRPTLRVTSNLMNATNFEVRPGQLILRNNLKYARIQQEGGTVQIPAMTIRARRAKALAFNIGGTTVFAKSARIPAHSVTLPPRKFILFQVADIRWILARFSRAIREAK